MHSSTRQQANSILFRFLKPVWLVLLLLTIAIGSRFTGGEQDPDALTGGESATAINLTRSSNDPGARQLASDPGLSFTENAGQWSDDVHFRAEVRGVTMWYTQHGVYYQMTRVKRGSGDDVNRQAEFASERTPAVEQLLVRSRLVGSDPDAYGVGEERLAQYSNYFLGNDPAKWRSNVSHYRSIVYPDVYPGIDVRYYGREGKPEYDFVVHPGADPSRIQMAYDGVTSMDISEAGDLVLQTTFGSIVESPPYAYQVRGDEHVPIEAQFVMGGDGNIGFAFAAPFDPSLPLIIDPVIDFGTYLGGSSEDAGFTPGGARQSVAVDGSGNAFVTSYTMSADFPVALALDVTIGGSIDAFVTKFASDGTLAFSTYLGGSDDDWGFDIGVDGAGDVYITGFTWSPDFPTLNPVQGSHAGSGDAFVTKLSAPGNTVLFSTYLGGTPGSDWALAMAVTSAGEVYVAGEATGSTNFPTTGGAYQPSYGGGFNDGFVFKLDPSIGGPSSLIYATYLGGINGDFAHAITVDASGRAIVALTTQSSGLPTDHDTYVAGQEIYIARLSAAGDAISGATYFGGTGDEWAGRLALGPNNLVYLAGESASPGIVTGGYDVTYGGNTDAIVAAFDPAALMQPTVSTYVGGSGFDRARAIAVDSAGYVYATGATVSGNFPLVDPIDATFGGTADVFVSVLTGDLLNLEFSSYLGATGEDEGLDLDVLGSGVVYVVGHTNVPGFPTTPGAFDETWNGNYDLFVMKISQLAFDTDGDGVPNVSDNCPDVANSDQANDDLDTLGNVCDNCPTTDNNDQADLDVDGLGDVCDSCPNDAANDSDADGHCADVDNCPKVANPAQVDSNGNGIGDACDIGQELKFFLFSPVDMIVTDPVGDSIGIGFNTIGLGSTYDTLADSNSAALTGPDGDPDDIVTIPAPRVGDYTVKIIPEPGASGGDHFTLSIRINGNQLLSPGGYTDQLVSALGSTVPDTYTYTTALTLPGDVNADGSITSADIIYMVGYVFKGGPPPVIPGHSDVNCDGNDTSADIIALVNYVFKSAAPPCSQTEG